jgi:hypothetical protein
MFFPIDARAHRRTLAEPQAGVVLILMAILPSLIWRVKKCCSGKINEAGVESKHKSRRYYPNLNS